MRTVWFYRDYQRLYGGHLKHSHYFGHVADTPGFGRRITFAGEPATETLARERLQLWPPGDAGAAAHWDPGRDDILFLAGVDWRYLAARDLDAQANPRINLIQHVRHAHAGTELYAYLEHRAVRICVSEEVAVAIRATGRVKGPVLAIPNGIDTFPDGPPGGADEARRRGVVIAGYKAPELAKALSTRLTSMGIEHLALTEFRRREEYLDFMASSRVAVCLPRAEEGFYLPALESMALGCLVVTLDCVGNRGFCRHERNCLVAAPTAESLAAATERMLQMPPAERDSLRQQSRATATEYSLEAERVRFQAVLADIDRLWRDG